MPEPFDDNEEVRRFHLMNRVEFNTLQAKYPDIERWAATHTWAYHPSTPEQCGNCLETIERLGGPMPPREAICRADTLLWRLRDPARAELQYRQNLWAGRRPRLSRVVFERDGHACRVCGATEGLTIDHIVPLAQGGPSVESNLWTLCKGCNSRKRTYILPFQLNLFTTGKTAVARGN